jgi:mono/diheme cytochrome c family protein
MKPAVAAFISLGVAAAVAFAAKPSVAPAAAAGDAAHGKQIFAEHCQVCHGPAGKGGEAPSLKNEASRKSVAQLEAWIKKPAPPMPTLYPSPLSAQDVADVAAYVETLK